MTENQDMQICDWIYLETVEARLVLPIMTMFKARTLTAADLDKYCPRWYGQVAGVVREWDEARKQFVQMPRLGTMIEDHDGQVLIWSWFNQWLSDPEAPDDYDDSADGFLHYMRSSEDER